MKGFLRAVEAAIAVMIMLMAFQFLYTVRFTFHPHESRTLSNVASSTLQTYHSTISYYINQADLKTLESLFDSIIPYGFGYKFQLDYFEPTPTLFSSSGYRPLDLVADFSYSVDPGSVKIQDHHGVFQDTQMVWNWYRIPFQIINNEEAKTYTSTVYFDLDWQDTNNDGIKEPIDHTSLTLYINSTAFDHTLINLTNVGESDKVYLNISTPLSENEILDGFLYYKVIA
jgi:hypothetical protein